MFVVALVGNVDNETKTIYSVEKLAGEVKYTVVYNRLYF
jgi:hypothetical protein